MNFIKNNIFNVKLVILVIGIIIILYCILQCTENFINEEPFKIVFDDIPNPLILNEGIYLKNGQTKIPIIISQKVNNIVSFTIDSNYYALIGINNTEPKIYRGEHIIQNDNIFKNITSLQIIKNF